nr:phage holin family protein [Kibdelosporangium sp. MJ126-NF4]CEL22534.1 putative integral membrane protein [Kibdelosporangium sp. MJ126-NF4]CTQ89390.1 putative integral membrane protein [Kibdelosporangium sp. MJ126-NF4]
MNSHDDERSVATLVGDLAEQTSRLVKAEARLAAQEMTSKTKRALFGTGAFGAAGLLGFYGGMLLLACAVLALATVLAPWLAALIVGGAVLLLAGIAALIGKSQLRKGIPPVPDDMGERVRADIQVVTHHEQKGAGV